MPGARGCGEDRLLWGQRTDVSSGRLGVDRRGANVVGAILLEQNDEWTVARRCMTLESTAPVSDNLTVKLPPVAARESRPCPPDTATGAGLLHHPRGPTRNSGVEARIRRCKSHERGDGFGRNK